MTQDDTAMKHPDPEHMGAGDWVRWLGDNPDKRIAINGPEGVHTVSYDPDDDQVTFYAHGSMGYDLNGTLAVLEEIAHSSDGIIVEEKP